MNWWWTAHTLIWTFLLPLIYHIIKKRKPRLSLCLLLFYFMLVFTVTGVGTLRDLLYTHSPFNIDLVPFRLGMDLQNSLNIVMIVPFGFLVPLIWHNYRSWKKIALAGFVFSALIEGSQLLNWRATTVEDLITNTFGAVIGYFLFKYIFSTSKQSPSQVPGTPLTMLLLSFIGVFLLSSVHILPTSWQPTRTLTPSLMEDVHNGIIIDMQGSDLYESVDH